MNNQAFPVRPGAAIRAAVAPIALGLSLIAWGAGAQEVSEPFACHPDYTEPCVPIGPEEIPPCDRVPEFAFPVPANDPLDLDHDDDGLGCEGIQETIWGDDLCEVAYCR